MKAFSTALALAALSPAAFAAAPVKIQRDVNFPKYASGKVIVELADASVLGKRDEDIHARFFEELDKRIPSGWTTKKVFKSKVFNGASLVLKNAEDVAKLASIKGIKNVKPVPVIKRPEPLGFYKPSTSQISQPADQFAPNVMTSVDKIHATGNFGKGIKIGILDTGVDYTHPALGGGFGPGFKVAGGFDLVGDNYPTTEPQPDSDPLDQCAGHGTHVAGIIGANPDNEFNITGVAYEASLYAYRIFGCTGGVDDDVIVDGLIRAFNEGNDVITLSLGGPDGWTESSSSTVASRISAEGRVVTIAAGNEGETGAWFTSSPGNGINVISVSSVNNIVSGPLRTVVTSLDHPAIPYFTDGGLNPVPGNVTLPLYAISKDSTVEDDACNPLPASTPDLSKFVTLVRRGTCSFAIKVANIAAKGGKYVLIYNNGGSFGAVTTGSEFAALIRDADGLFLLQQFVAGTKFTVSFPSSGAFVNLPNEDDGGLVSGFTTFGPTFDMYFKPAVAAPGGGILGTWPVPLGSFAVLSGTSMATPHTAGVSALILKAKGKGVATSMRTLLETTSKTIPQTLAEGAAPQTLTQAGAGLIDAYSAITYTTSVSPGELLLNDTANWNGLHTILIKNGGKKIKTYTLKHVPAGTAITRPTSGGIQIAQGPVPQSTDAAIVHLTLSRITILPGLTLPVILTISPPKGVNASTVPVVSGHIEIASTDGAETLHVSYLGAAANLKTVQVVDTSPDVVGFPTPLLVDASGSVQTDPTNYTFVGTDFPVLAWRQVFGTSSIKVDLVAANISLATNLKRSLYDWLSWWWPGLPRPSGTFGKVPTLGPLFTFQYLGRNDLTDTPYYEQSIPGTFANGTAIPVGQYRALFRALRVGGTAWKEEDYEVWLSPVIGVVAP